MDLSVCSKPINLREFALCILTEFIAEVEMKEVLLVCDGCSLGNSDYRAGDSRASAAAILEFKGRRKIYAEYLGNASNQQAEIIAACIGLEQLRAPCRVTVISD